MSERCEHVFGYREDEDYSGRLVDAYGDNWELSGGWCSVTERFAFCPRCGIRFDWDKINANYAAHLAERDRLTEEQERKRKEGQERAALTRLANQRMRGAHAEDW